MGRKNIIIILFALVLTLLIPGMETEAKTKPKLTENKKTMTAAIFGNTVSVYPGQRKK